MRIHKTTLLLTIVFIFLLALSVAMAIYIFIPGSYITVEDKSEHYNISYKDKKAFEEYLKELGAFEKNHATLIGGNHMFTLKKIHIILTDSDNGRYSQLYPNKTSIASVNIGGSKKDGTLIFAVYISPNEKYRSRDDLSSTGLFQILTGLRTTIGTKALTTQQVLDLAGEDMRKLNNSTPLLITPQNNK